MIQSIKLVYKNGFTQSYVPEGLNIQLYRVLHDYELGAIRDTAPAPEVFPMNPKVATLMTEELQWYCFDLLFWHYRHGDRHNVTSEEKQIFTSVYQGVPGRFITNGRGVEAYANFITGERLDQPLPAIFDLLCGGDVITGTEFTKLNGTKHLAVMTLNSVPSVQEVRRSTRPWLVQVATIVTGKSLPDKTYQVNAFPQLGTFDVCVPIISEVPVSYPLWKLRKLPLGTPVPSPYNPPRLDTSE